VQKLLGIVFLCGACVIGIGTVGCKKPGSASTTSSASKTIVNTTEPTVVNVTRSTDVKATGVVPATEPKVKVTRSTVIAETKASPKAKEKD
jgi:hypothetical protein